MRLDPARIDADADRVVRRLIRHGYKAYLVGGCVRDLLLGRTPKDFDVATSATPNQIREVFRNSRIIGRRFRLAHVFFGDKIIETSTFRATPRHDSDGELLIRRDNVFGSATEDARRRDFTINGLFYDVSTEKVIDYVGGLDDLQAHLVRTIGDPDIRFREDPVRMLRAIKFAARLDCEIEPATYEALLCHRGELEKCSPVRVAEEVYRLLRGGAARRSVELLHDTGIDTVLSPRMAALFGDAEGDGRAWNPADHVDDPELPSEPMDAEEAEWWRTWQPASRLELSFLTDPAEVSRRRACAWRVLDLLDELSANGHELSNPLLLAAILGPFMSAELSDPNVKPGEATALILELGGPLIEELHVARRDAESVRQILQAQRRLTQTRRRRAKSSPFVRREYFNDALATCELIARAEGRDTDDLDYWRELRRAEGIDDEDSQGRRRRRRRGGRRRRRGAREVGAAAGA